jgi:hypothetical protein
LEENEMSKTVEIGTWIESESRDVVQSGSYAADTELLRTREGEYPARVIFEAGYGIPKPYWLMVKIDADRISGKTYSGFGGVNFASRDLPLKPAPFRIQAYAYQIRDLVDAGKIEILPEYEWLTSDDPRQHPDAPQTWAEITA